MFDDRPKAVNNQVPEQSNIQIVTNFTKKQVIIFFCVSYVIIKLFQYFDLLLMKILTVYSYVSDLSSSSNMFNFLITELRIAFILQSNEILFTSCILIIRVAVKYIFSAITVV